MLTQEKEKLIEGIPIKRIYEIYYHFIERSGKPTEKILAPTEHEWFITKNTMPIPIAPIRKELKSVYRLLLSRPIPEGKEGRKNKLMMLKEKVKSFFLFRWWNFILPLRQPIRNIRKFFSFINLFGDL